jgi:hypothetical protein
VEDVRGLTHILPALFVYFHRTRSLSNKLGLNKKIMATEGRRCYRNVNLTNNLPGEPAASLAYSRGLC